ncbi:mitogen-activated protein kinase kinase kinase 21 [Striga hermonthica]|uniref:Mitogen-activated protein kinase kinase kinase 21 n=1 Tax=Striga hermonthica TaxID=68872 RepID=A0A9N7N2V8_STRHE|nr:mitogen-activated protein kinase kinase kinase 21 [Striga hermonthica]
MGWVRGETLGKGGFGFVSMAKTNQDHNLPPLIAVKSSKVSESESLKKEKELLDKFQSCPSILRCFGDEITTENGEKLYNILLEYASAGCLADHIVKGLPEITVSRCTKSLLSALLHIHKAGYVHCDVKPHNVLLVGQDAKLADFGSCCKTSFHENSSCDDFRGTVMYAAPESIAQQNVDNVDFGNLEERNQRKKIPFKSNIKQEEKKNLEARARSSTSCHCSAWPSSSSRPPPWAPPSSSACRPLSSAGPSSPSRHSPYRQPLAPSRPFVLPGLCLPRHRLFSVPAARDRGLFALKKSSLSMLKSPRDPREAKAPARLECGVLMAMFAVQLGVMILCCAVRCSMAREYHGLDAAETKEINKEVKKREFDEKMMRSKAIWAVDEEA